MEVKRKHKKRKPTRSLFETQTFWAAVIAFATTLATTVTNVHFDGGWEKEDIFEIIAATSAFALVLNGKMRRNEDLENDFRPVVTPPFLPGANESDFYIDKKNETGQTK